MLLQRLLPALALLTAAVADQQPLAAPDASLAPLRQGWSYINCGLEDDIVDLQSLEVTPDPPQPGQNLTVKATGRVKELIEDGAFAEVVVKLGLIKLLKKEFDICEEAQNANLDVQCPVSAGTYTIEQSVLLPKEIPKAKFTVDVVAFTKDEEPMLCLKIMVDFMKKPFFKFF